LPPPRVRVAWGASRGRIHWALGVMWSQSPLTI